MPGRSSLPPGLLHQVERSTEEALAMYREGAVLNPDQIDEARADFWRFYLAVISLRLRGIRWNFDGCIMCPRAEGYAIARRVLITHPDVLAAAGGRALGTLLCFKHSEATGDEQVQAALKRIREAPPKA